MDIVFNFLRSDIFLFILLVAVIILFVLYIISVANLKKLRVSYSKFMNKLGNGNNLEEMMKEYIKRVNTAEAKNEEIISYCKVIDENIIPIYECDCSKQHFEEALITIGKEELKSMIDEDEKAEIICHFCNKKYYFSKEELLKIYEKINNESK